MTTLYPHSDVATGRERLAGQELLDFVHSNPTMTHTERCLGAGYFKQLDNGSQGPSFTEFFEAILDARKANGEYETTTRLVGNQYKTIVTTGEYYEVNGRDWYEDVLDDQGRALYDMIEDRCPEFSKLDAAQCQEFMDELSDNGINNADDFESAYYYRTDSWNAESEFAQFYAEEIACLDVMNDASMGSFLVIDWQATWDSALCYDFFTIEFDGETYFFSSNF